MTLQTSMTEALRLTRAGNLAGATALIRAALSGGSFRHADAPVEEPVALVPDRVTVTARGVRPEQRVTIPAGCFEARRHQGSAGVIDYMLYRPAGATAAMPLVVMLHGCTQTPEDFARGTKMNQLADELGFLVAYPRQSHAANAQKCWNWFRPGDQERGRGEPALIAGLTQDIVTAESANGARIYVAGLSAGGAAAAIMAAAYPDIFAAVGIHSGLACGAARDLPSALAAMRNGLAGKGTGRQGPGRQGAVRAAGSSGIKARFVPVITFHGDRDRTVHETNAKDIVEAAMTAAGVPIVLKLETGDAGGRRYTRALSRNKAGRVLIEQWTIAGAGHAWSGGDPKGSYADAAGPDASRAMLRFFLGHEKPAA